MTVILAAMLWPVVQAVLGCIGLFHVMHLRKETGCRSASTMLTAAFFLGVLLASFVASFAWRRANTLEWNLFPRTDAELDHLSGWCLFAIVVLVPLTMTCAVLWEFLRWTWQPSPPSAREIGRGLGLGVAVLCCVVFCLTFLPYPGGDDRSLSVLQDRAVEIRDAVHRYASEHDGAWPRSLGALYVEGCLSDWKIVEWTGGRFVYESPSPGDAFGTIVAHSWPPYRGRVVVLDAWEVIEVASVSDQGELAFDYSNRTELPIAWAGRR